MEHDEHDHHCNFTPEEVAAFKTTFEHGKTFRKGVINALAGALALAMLAIVLLGLAMTVKAISQASLAQLLERAVGLPAP